MRVKLNLPDHKKFNAIIAPYELTICVGNMKAIIGRGSFTSIYRCQFVGFNDVAPETIVLRVGSYCEFAVDSKIIIGGEHLSQSEIIVNTFSEAPHLRALLGKNSRAKSKGLIEIGSNVIVSDRTTILSGAVISTNSIVAAGSIVTGRFNENSILGGVPAKFIKSIQVPKLAWWEYDEETIVKFLNNEDGPRKKSSTEGISISLKAEVDGYGKISKLDLNGVFKHRKFIPIQELNQNEIDYFEQASSGNEFIEVSDEMFQ